jgi:hypothetical protein
MRLRAMPRHKQVINHLRSGGDLMGSPFFVRTGGRPRGPSEPCGSADEQKTRISGENAAGRGRRPHPQPGTR